MTEAHSGGTLSSRTPRGFLRLLARLPIVLYRLRLGWLLGRRFLLLTHTGRKSGTEYATVLEVLCTDPSTGRDGVCDGTGSALYRPVNWSVRYRLWVGRESAMVSERKGESRRGLYHRTPRAFWPGETALIRGE